MFTAGVGENGPMVRRMVCEYLEFLGVKISEEENLKAFGKQVVLSTPDSTIKVAVIPTNEELAIARDTLRLTSAPAAPAIEDQDATENEI